VAVLLGLVGLGLVLGGGWRGGGLTPSDRTVTLVVSARALEAGTTLTTGDLTEVGVPASGALSALAHSSVDVLGRKLVVAVASGTPLSAALVSSSLTAGVPGHRLVRLSLESAALPPDLVPGCVVDVVAAVAEPSDGGRVVTVATAGVVTVAGGSPSVVTLDTDATGAARLVWSQTFAKSLRLLVRPSAADQPPPDVGGLGR
jgi:hypothetical protein